MSQNLQSQFDILRTSQDGRIFANFRPDQIRANPDQLVLPLLKQFLDLNPQINPETCLKGMQTSDKLNNIINQLQNQAQTIVDQVSTQTAQMIQTVPDTQDTVKQLMIKSERLKSVLQISQIQIQKFPESTVQIERIRNDLELKKGALRALQQQDCIQRAPALISTLIFQQDLASAVILLYLAEITSKQTGQLINRQLQDARKIVETELKKQIQACIKLQTLLDKEFHGLNFITQFQTDVTQFQDIKTTQQYLDRLSLVRAMISVKCGTYQKVIDFRQNLHGLDVKILETKLYSDLKINHKLLQVQEITLQDYILILGQSLLLLEESSDVCQLKNSFSICDEIQANLEDLSQIYFMIEKATRSNVFSQINIVDPNQSQLKLVNQQQQAKALLVNFKFNIQLFELSLAQSQIMELVRNFAFSIYSMLQMIHLFDISLNFTDTSSIKSLHYSNSQRFVFNAGQVQVPYFNQQQQRISFKQIIQNVFQLFIEFSYHSVNQICENAKFAFSLKNTRHSNVLFELGFIQNQLSSFTDKQYLLQLKNYVLFEGVLSQLNSAFQYYQLDRYVSSAESLQKLQQLYFKHLKQTYKHDLQQSMNQVQKNVQIDQKCLQMIIQELTQLIKYSLCVNLDYVTELLLELEDQICEFSLSILEQKLKPILSFKRTFEDSTVVLTAQNYKQAVFHSPQIYSDKIQLMNEAQLQFVVDFTKFLYQGQQIQSIYEQMNVKAQSKMIVFSAQVEKMVIEEQKTQISFALILYKAEFNYAIDIDYKYTAKHIMKLKHNLDILNKTQNNKLKEAQITEITTQFTEQWKDVQMKPQYAADLMRNMEILLVANADDPAVDTLIRWLRDRVKE
ncbi:Conserved_hypothetical protein [Hexamita inflata]|uniref:Uncharacterized protein n=1 Tax=Hexamita inflata TaxID=28002 RepID=A0AA86PFX1_9EUKA|nr:Conserved hypothetical protein [Hexamita inflata]